MPDGSMVKLKNEVAQDSPAPSQQAQGLGLGFTSGTEHGIEGQAPPSALLPGAASASGGINGADAPTPSLL